MCVPKILNNNESDWGEAAYTACFYKAGVREEKHGAEPDHACAAYRSSNSNLVRLSTQAFAHLLTPNLITRRCFRSTPHALGDLPAEGFSISSVVLFTRLYAHRMTSKALHRRWCEISHRDPSVSLLTAIQSTSTVAAVSPRHPFGRRVESIKPSKS